MDDEQLDDLAEEAERVSSVNERYVWSNLVQLHPDVVLALIAEIRRLRNALRAVQEWERALIPADGIRYGSYYPAFVVQQALGMAKEEDADPYAYLDGIREPEE